MKFGALLRTTADDLPEVTYLFDTYKKLKKQLKKLPNRTQVSSAADDRAQQLALSEDEAQFVATIDRSLASLNNVFLEKEEEAVICLEALQAAAAAATSDDVRRSLYKSLIDFHGEVLLLVHWSVLAYTATVKILKKHHKRTGLLLRAPQLENLLSQPFCSTELMTQLARRAEASVHDLAHTLGCSTTATATAMEPLAASPSGAGGGAAGVSGVSPCSSYLADPAAAAAANEHAPGSSEADQPLAPHGAAGGPLLPLHLAAGKAAAMRCAAPAALPLHAASAGGAGGVVHRSSGLGNLSLVAPHDQLLRSRVEMAPLLALADSLVPEQLHQAPGAPFPPTAAPVAAAAGSTSLISASSSHAAVATATALHHSASSSLLTCGTNPGLHPGQAASGGAGTSLRSVPGPGQGANDDDDDDDEEEEEEEEEEDSHDSDDSSDAEAGMQALQGFLAVRQQWSRHCMSMEPSQVPPTAALTAQPYTGSQAAAAVAVEGTDNVALSCMLGGVGHNSTAMSAARGSLVVGNGTGAGGGGNGGLDLLRRTRVALNTWSQLRATAITPSTCVPPAGLPTDCQASPGVAQPSHALDGSGAAGAAANATGRALHTLNSSGGPSAAARCISLDVWGAQPRQPHGGGSVQGLLVVGAGPPAVPVALTAVPALVGSKRGREELLGPGGAAAGEQQQRGRSARVALAAAVAALAKPVVGSEVGPQLEDSDPVGGCAAAALGGGDGGGGGGYDEQEVEQPWVNMGVVGDADVDEVVEED